MGPRARAGVALTWSLLMVPFWAPPGASAQEPDRQEARAAFEAGQEAYRAGRFDEALERFVRAHELTGEPDLLYNIATVHDRLRHDPEALEAYRAYLEARPGAEDRANIEARIRVLQDAVDREQQAPPLEASPAPSETEAPTLPEATADDEEVAQMDAAATPPDDGGVGAGPWIVLGAGVALAAAGGVSIALALSDIDDVESARDVPWSEVQDAHDRAPVLSAAGFAAAGVGVALIATGVLWAALGGDDDAPVQVGVGPLGIAIRGEM